MTVTVLALAVAKKGSEEEVRKNLLSQVEPTRKEEGCINYDLHQSKDDPTKFMFYENWISKETLSAHAASAHIAQSRLKNEGLLERPIEITIWEHL
jgi:quinol monooxygenase YgiN